MSKAVVMGNGESRSWYNPNTKWADVRTWGCNAVYRDAATRQSCCYGLR